MIDGLGPVERSLERRRIGDVRTDELGFDAVGQRAGPIEHPAGEPARGQPTDQRGAHHTRAPGYHDHADAPVRAAARR